MERTEIPVAGGSTGSHAVAAMSLDDGGPFMRPCRDREAGGFYDDRGPKRAPTIA